MDKIREALESARGYIGITKAMYGVAADPHLEKIDEALAALSAPVSSDARELAESIWDLVHMAGGPMTEECAMSEAAAIIERFVAERERKAREETVDKCIDAVHTWMLRGQSGGEIGLIAKFNAIKDAGNA